MMDNLHKFFRKRVEVRAHGIIYRGFLIGADEESLYMIGTTSYLILPLEAVTAVRDEGSGEGDWIKKEIDGAPKRGPEELDGKRRWSKADLEKLHMDAAPQNWPEQDDQEDDDNA